jgi:dCMP deaminase
MSGFDEKPSVPSNGNNTRRTWDEYFYEMAKLVSSRSRDDCPVGAVVVGEDQVVIATGYNGLPRRVADLEDRLQKEEKLCWTVHAESNAICNAARVGASTKGSTIYVTKFPCATCSGALAQSGVLRLVTHDKYMWKNDPTGDDGRRSLRILMEAGIEIHAPNIEIGEISRRSIRNGAKNNGTSSKRNRKGRQIASAVRRNLLTAKRTRGRTTSLSERVEG